jgi:hypothetical protein
MILDPVSPSTLNFAGPMSQVTLAERGTRIARGLNRVMQRAGSVLDDRFHAHILRTPTEVRHVRNYLINNAHHHYGQTGRDEYTSEAPLVAPQTFLLRQLC